MTDLRIVFDDFPSPKGARLIEVENSEGHSINAGEWKQRDDGYVELLIPNETQKLKDLIRRSAKSLMKDYYHDDDAYLTAVGMLVSIGDDVSNDI